MPTRSRRYTGARQSAPTGPEVHTVAFDGIAFRPEFQVRGGLDDENVRRLRNAYTSEQPVPPVSLIRINGENGDNSALVLVDGWHRVEALQRNGKHSVEATIEDGTYASAQWAAAEANLRHGLRLKSNELRGVFKAYMESGSYKRSNGSLKSYREMTRDMGGLRGHTTIRNWMKRQYPDIAAEIGGNDEATTGFDAERIGGEEYLLSEGKTYLLDATHVGRMLRREDYRGELVLPPKIRWPALRACLTAVLIRLMTTPTSKIGLRHLSRTALWLFPRLRA